MLCVSTKTRAQLRRTRVITSASAWISSRLDTRLLSRLTHNFVVLDPSSSSSSSSAGRHFAAAFTDSRTRLPSPSFPVPPQRLRTASDRRPDRHRSSGRAQAQQTPRVHRAAIPCSTCAVSETFTRTLRRIFPASRLRLPLTCRPSPKPSPSSARLSESFRPPSHGGESPASKAAASSRHFASCALVSMAPSTEAASCNVRDFATVALQNPYLSAVRGNCSTALAKQFVRVHLGMRALYFAAALEPEAL